MLIIIMACIAVGSAVAIYCLLRLMYLRGRSSALSEARGIMDEGLKELDQIWADKKAEVEAILRGG